VAVRPPDEVLDAVAAGVANGQTVADGLRWEDPRPVALTLQFLGPAARLGPVVDAWRGGGGAGRLSRPARGAGAFSDGEAGPGGVDRRRRRGDALVGLAGAVSAALRPVGFEPDGPCIPTSPWPG